MLLNLKLLYQVQIFVLNKVVVIKTICFSYFFFTRGYCTGAGPREYKTILINTLNVKKVHYGYEFDLFTFSSLNWLYDLFYLDGKKRISPELINYLTPMALAFLIMDYGGWVSPLAKGVTYLLKVLESLLIILLCKKFNYWVRCLRLSLI